MTEKDTKAIKEQCWFLLRQLLSEEQANTWWYSRNTAFEAETPEQYFKTNPTKVLEYLSRVQGDCYS